MKDPDLRLGSGEEGVDEIRNHPFFKSIDWEAIYNKKIRPPFIPNVKSDLDHKYIDPVNRIYFNFSLGIY